MEVKVKVKESTWPIEELLALN